MADEQKTWLITGGTGSFGKTFAKFLLTKNFARTIRIFSRDEFKQSEMMTEFGADERLRFLIGDVRDKDRLKLACQDVDIIIHAAALKQIPLCEYNPFEAVKTNILGSQNIVESALETKVSKVLLISSDKAVAPINLYGATKLVAEKIFIQANSYVGKRQTRFTIVRFGNVLGSRGSIIPIIRNQKKKDIVTLTDSQMTRFWITKEETSKFVFFCLEEMQGGEIFVPKLPSVKIVDLIKTQAPSCKIKIIGRRIGEKLHESLLTEEESLRLQEFPTYYKIMPQFQFWKTRSINSKLNKKPFSYQSNLNSLWLKGEKLKSVINGLE